MTYIKSFVTSDGNRISSQLFNQYFLSVLKKFIKPVKKNDFLVLFKNILKENNFIFVPSFILDDIDKALIISILENVPKQSLDCIDFS